MVILLGFVIKNTRQLKVGSKIYEKNKVCKIFSVVMILVSALVCPISSNAYSFLKTEDGSADISGLRDSYIVFQSWNGFTQKIFPSFRRSMTQRSAQ